MIGAMRKRTSPAAANPVVETLLATSLPAAYGTQAMKLLPARRSKLRLYDIAITLLLVFALALPAFAKSWRVSNLQDTITVNPDGSALKIGRASCRERV